MIDFLVNKIEEVDGLTTGIVTDNLLVIHNLNLIYGEHKTINILAEIERLNQNCYSISRFGDYVGFLNYQLDLGFSLKLTDFDNNFDKALDEYLNLINKDWKKEDTIKYLKIAKEIEAESQPSKMTILNTL